MNPVMMSNSDALNEGLIKEYPPDGWIVRYAIKLKGDGVQAPLTIVLCKKSTPGTPKYVVWAHNRQDGGYHHGSYLSNFPAALEVFFEKLKIYGFHLVEELE